MDNGASALPTGLSSQATEPDVSALRASIPSAAGTDDPEPAMHSEHLLRITQLDYLRLRYWLSQQIAMREDFAKALDEDGQADRAKFERGEAVHLTRIAGGLHSRWKPGRAPNEIGRDRLRAQAIETRSATTAGRGPQDESVVA